MGTLVAGWAGSQMDLVWVLAQAALGNSLLPSELRPSTGGWYAMSMLPGAAAPGTMPTPCPGGGRFMGWARGQARLRNGQANRSSAPRPDFRPATPCAPHTPSHPW